MIFAEVGKREDDSMHEVALYQSRQSRERWRSGSQNIGPLAPASLSIFDPLYLDVHSRK